MGPAAPAGVSINDGGSAMATGPEGGDDVLLDGNISEVALDLDDVGEALAGAQGTAQDQVAVIP